MSRFLLVALLVLSNFAYSFSDAKVDRPPSEIAEPGLSYGAVPDFPLPKTILFSAAPEEIVADAEEWERRGITAFFMDDTAREWSSDIWAVDGKPWTLGESDETFQKAKQANEVCRRIGSETFLKIAFDHHFEWWNDIAWDRAYNNFKQFAVFARESGCNGMALDIEYVGEQYDFNWKGYDYDGYTREDLVEKIRERMTRVIQILYDEFPDMVFLTYPEQGLGLGSVIHVAWVEEAAKRNAPGGIHYCTEWTYRNPNIRYMFGHAWSCNLLFQTLLSEKGKEYWREKCTIAAGVWPFGFNYQNVYAPGITVEEFRQAYAASLMMSPRYNWIYSHNCRPLMIGRKDDEYSGEAPLQDYLDIIRAREIVTDKKYIGLAKDLRAMRLRDYSHKLGMRPTPTLVSPRNRVEIGRLPVSGENTEAEKKKSEEMWDLGLRLYEGENIDLRKYFGTVDQWNLIGPFDSPAYKGYDEPFPPENEIDLLAEYKTGSGTARWVEYDPTGTDPAVNLKAVFQPSENVCGYGLCFVASPDNRKVQFRVSTNDSGKMWVGGKLVYENPDEGRIELDRDTVPVELPKGTTPILLKACNGEADWGFILRITDDAGNPFNDLEYSLQP
jgi:hypothetical protein